MKRIWLARALAVWFLVRGILYAVNFVWKLLFVNDPDGSFQLVTYSGGVINRSMDCMDFIAFAVLMTAWNNLYHFREKGRKYAIFCWLLAYWKMVFGPFCSCFQSHKWFHSPGNFRVRYSCN